MNRYLLFFNLILIPFFISAQETELKISGIVLNVTTGEPIEDVHVRLDGVSDKGVVTGSEGRFTIRLDSFPSTLIFSRIGFETGSLLVESDSLIEIRMYQVSTDLPEVMVSARRKVDTVFHEPYSVVDFVFKEDDLLLLVFRSSIEKYELILLDQEEDILDRLPLKEEKPSSLFKSCRDSFYLNTYYGTWKIAVNKNKLSLDGRLDDADYEFRIKPCMLAVDSLMFYKRHLYQGQALRYYAFNYLEPDGDSLAVLPLIEDEDQIFRLIEETGNRVPRSGDFWEEQVSFKLKGLREDPYYLKGKFRMFYPELYAPIFKQDSSICLFNHLAGKIQLFDSKGVLIKETPIQYHKIKRWKKYLVQDEASEDVYTAFHTRWGEYICKVNIETGELSPAIPLDLAFIENVKIKDGTMYFLHRDPYRGQRKKMIQKVRLN